MFFLLLGGTIQSKPIGASIASQTYFFSLISVFFSELCVFLFPVDHLVIVVSLQKYWNWKEQIAPFIKTVSIHHWTWEFIVFQSTSLKTFQNISVYINTAAAKKLFQRIAKTTATTTVMCEALPEFWCQAKQQNDMWLLSFTSFQE